ncbi:hypothetical protein AB0A84_06780 [Streptomyces albidoflavus]|uniref:hypothetical protein n=1 Tax=Streptomyces albidoflavus TaxID=1886 RepID=UPI0033EF7C99
MPEDEPGAGEVVEDPADDDAHRVSGGLGRPAVQRADQFRPVARDFPVARRGGGGVQVVDNIAITTSGVMDDTMLQAAVRAVGVDNVLSPSTTLSRGAPRPSASCAART